jgi:hypothetical protein
MGDQDQGHVFFFHEFTEQSQDLSLDRYIKGGGWFIGNQQIRTASHGDGDDYPLPLPSRKLVRV